MLTIVEQAVTITSFVIVMMLLIEYVNVQTRGRWQQALQRGRWKQYLLAASLGALPGCLGAFTVVSLYTHRVVGFGALVAAMIATSGDEAYVMLSLFPLKALVLTAILLAIGVGAGYVTDLTYRRSDRLLGVGEHALPLHAGEACDSLPRGTSRPRTGILPRLRAVGWHRAALIGILAALIIAAATGAVGGAAVGGAESSWVRVSLLVSGSFALFVAATVPDHFLEEHLWEHVLKKHLLWIFLWTAGALLAIQVLEQYVELEEWIRGNVFTTLVIASVVGLIPASGPHLIFVTLFAQGTIPFSVLVANSIVQDGDGTLPLLASSKRGFVGVKLVSIVVGIVIGALALAAGW